MPGLESLALADRTASCRRPGNLDAAAQGGSRAESSESSKRSESAVSNKSPELAPCRPSHSHWLGTVSSAVAANVP